MAQETGDRLLFRKLFRNVSQFIDSCTYFDFFFSLSLSFFGWLCSVDLPLCTFYLFVCHLKHCLSG